MLWNFIRSVLEFIRKNILGPGRTREVTLIPNQGTVLLRSIPKLRFSQQFSFYFISTVYVWFPFNQM